MAALLRRHALGSVCEEARCPNRRECFGRGTAAFLILGGTCTRGCRFCAVPAGAPHPPDPGEPERVAAAAGLLGLGHVVVTSVTRDDLPDGGAGAFAATVAALRRRLPGATAEILTPDFGGDPRAAAALLEHPPDVFNHNVETVPRLYARVRPGASYRRSLDLLARMAARGLRVKSGLMVGLGETDDEVGEVLGDLREAGVSLLTLGQYLRPTRASLPVERYVVPGRFDIWRQMGYTIGFTHVASGPLVRSSFRAEEGARRAIGERLPPPGPGPSAGPRIGGGHAPPADGGES